MKRRIQGLRETAQPRPDAVPDGVFLVRVDRAQYRWHPAKPFYFLRLSVIEPRELAGRVVSGRVYCTAKAMWKLGWFLRDFLYDPELLGREEVDEQALSGLRGVGEDQLYHRQWYFPPQFRWLCSCQSVDGAVFGLSLKEHRI